VTITTIKTLLAASPLPRLEAHLLLQHVLHVPRAWLIAHDTDTLPPAKIQEFLHWQDRRIQGEPIAYLLGTREFMGHEFHVAAGVLIPRPETELLVEQAITAIKTIHPLTHPRLPNSRPPRILDLGTGSGAIAISLALALPHAKITATDASPQALHIAAGNAARLNAAVTFHQGHWYDALPPDTPAFDLIVSNPPYIAEHDPHLTQGDLRFEPHMALSSGKDGLDALRHLIAHAPEWLNRNGQLWLEHGHDQSHAVRTLLHQRGFEQVNSLPDLAGIPRITGGGGCLAE